MTTKVGFIGLGNMGSPMAIDLCKAGFEVRVFDLRDSAVEKLVSNGANAAADTAELVTDSDVIGICVVTDQQVIDLVEGVNGLLAASSDLSPRTFVLHSTILPETVKRVAAAFEKQGHTVLDAQVSGGDVRAADADLAVMVGGSKGDFDRLSSYFEAFGSHVRYMGPTGAGAATKLAMQEMFFVNQLAALEAVRFSSHYDISEDSLMDLVAATTGESFISRNWGFVDRQLFTHTLAGTPELYAFYDKDLHALVKAAQTAKTPMPIAGLAAQLLASSYEERRNDLKAGGVSAEDFS